MSDATQPTVFIVDDDDAVRDSIAELVDSIGLQAQTYDSALVFLAALEPRRPGCLVLDVRMAGMSGLVLLKRLKELANQLPVILLTGHGDVPMAVEAMKNGAVDFIQKPYREQELLDSINSALLQNGRDDRRDKKQLKFEENLSTLTKREREVFDQLCRGKSSKEIATTLSISPRTVETHRYHLLRKLNVCSVRDLLLLLADSTPHG